VLTVAQFHAGSTFNVIPQTAELCGTVRALSPEKRSQVLAALSRITKGVAETYRCSAEVELFGATPPTINTPAEAEFVRKVIAEVLGPQNLMDIPRPAMWGEDFAFYLEHVPGCFYLLGVEPPDRSSYPMLHNPQFDFTDAAVRPGIELMTQLAASKLSERR
jgi:hippurate hydrolase